MLWSRLGRRVLAICGRLPVGKGFLDGDASAGRRRHLFGLLLRRSWMAAGHNALRGSGPGQKHAVAHCQTNPNRPAKGAGARRSGRQLTPLGQDGGTVLSEDVAALEVTALIEMIVDRGVDGGKLLQSLYVPELRHRTLSSSERLV